MHTSLILVALMGPGEMLETPASPTPTWQDSYSEARQLGRQLQKPLAVFIGSGSKGWQNVIEEGKLSSRAQKLLAEKYVCVYVDRTKATGGRLARQFDVPEGSGLILSTQDGEGQAFFHAGQLSTRTLSARLSRHAGGRAVTRTERLAEMTVSYNTASSSPRSNRSNTSTTNGNYTTYPGNYGGFGGYTGGFTSGSC